MRRRKAERRTVNADPLYNDQLVSRFINSVMLSGKKSVAQRLVYQALEVIEEKTGETSIPDSPVFSGLSGFRGD